MAGERSQQPCVFYQQGRCRNGATCPFAHQTVPNAILEKKDWRRGKRCDSVAAALEESTGRPRKSSKDTADPDEMRPLLPWRRIVHPPKPTGPPDGLFVPCKFYQRGYCSRGATCAFGHVDAQGSALLEVRPNKGKDPAVHQPEKPKMVAEAMDPIRETEVRIMGTTLSVTFGPGLAITNVGSASDTSIVTIQNLPMDTSAEQVREIIAELQQDLPEEAVRAIPIEDATYATAKFKDAATALEAVKQLDGTYYNENRLSVKLYQSKGLANVSQSATRVSCTWFAPSRVASITFGTYARAQNAAQACEGKWIKGRKVATSLKSPLYRSSGSFGRPTSRGEVSIGDMALDTTAQDIKRVFRYGVESVFLHDPTYKLSPSEALSKIIKLFVSFKSDIEGYDIVSPPNSRKVKAIIRFKTAIAALDAVRDHNGRIQTFLGGSKIFLQPIYTANFKIAPEIHRAVSKELSSLSAEQPQGVQVRVFSGGVGGSHTLATVRITGQDKKEVSVAKAMVGKIVRGQLFQKKKGELGEGEPIWDPFWATADGIQKITEIGRETKTFIFCDKRKSQLFLFGAAENQEKAMRRLHESMASIAEKGHELALEGVAWKKVMRGGLQTLQEKYGLDKVKVNVVKRCIVFVGAPTELAEVLKSLEDTKKGESSAAEGADGDYCPICFDTAENPAQFASCQHAYCLSCLQDYIKSTIATRKFPITCVGEAAGGSVCGCALDMPVLATILSPIEFDAILSSAFTDHIRCHSEEYSYCPTPNCNTVYRSTTGDGNVFSCVDCLLEICTSCNVEAHDGMTCADFRLFKHSDEKADRAFEEWKKRNGVHSCPTCGTDIQKESGCNHITCASCKAHICWKCLKVFQVGGEVYEHMNREHGSIGIDYDFD